MDHGHIDQLPDFMYTYILSKTNDISFNTHLLVIAYYVHMYSVTLWFLFSSPCQTWWWPYRKKAETCCLSFDSLHLNKVLLCFVLSTLSIVMFNLRNFTLTQF